MGPLLRLIDVVQAAARGQWGGLWGAPAAREFLGGPPVKGSGAELRMLFATLDVSNDKFARQGMTFFFLFHIVSSKLSLRNSR